MKNLFMNFRSEMEKYSFRNAKFMKINIKLQNNLFFHGRKFCKEMTEFNLFANKKILSHLLSQQFGRLS